MIIMNEIFLFTLVKAYNVSIKQEKKVHTNVNFVTSILISKYHSVKIMLLLLYSFLKKICKLLTACNRHKCAQIEKQTRTRKKTD
jgi:hypothetical protein